MRIVVHQLDVEIIVDFILLRVITILFGDEVVLRDAQDGFRARARLEATESSSAVDAPILHRSNNLVLDVCHRMLLNLIGVGCPDKIGRLNS